MMEYMEFEEKVDFDDLVLPPKPMKMIETEISDIKQESLEEKISMLFLNQMMMQKRNLNWKWKKIF